MEKQLGHSKVSVILWVSAVEGCPLRGVPLIFLLYGSVLSFIYSAIHTSILVISKCRQAWYSFINLLDIDLLEGFFCELCGQVPDPVIMDGTSVSFRKALDSWRPLLQQSSECTKRVAGR